MVENEESEKVEGRNSVQQDKTGQVLGQLFALELKGKSRIKHDFTNYSKNLLLLTLAVRNNKLEDKQERQSLCVFF